MSAKFKAQRDRRDVLVTDLSRHGCKLSAPDLSLPVDQRVILKPVGLESLTAVVRWSVGSTLGIEFDWPLHSAIVEHLCGMHPSENPVVSLGLAA